MLGLFILVAAAFSGATALVDVSSCSCPNRLRYTVISENLSWFEAFEDCESRGLELVSITSQSEEDAIELILGNDTIGAEFWTAGTALATPSVFVWFTSGSELVYKNFATGQPDNLITELCVELFRQANGVWKWDNLHCSQKHPYICQTKSNCCYFN